MIDPTQMAGVLGSLNAAYEISKSYLELRSDVAVQGKVLDLQRAILEAQGHAMSIQQQHLAMAGRISELEKEIANLKAWDADKERYALEQVTPGLFAFALKEARSNGEPAHYLCASCYQNGKKSYLHNELIPAGRRQKIFCGGCGFSLILNQGDFTPHYKKPA